MKIIHYTFVFFLVLFNLNAYSNQQQEPVFCPASLYCDESNRLSSCHYEQPAQGYWRRISNTSYPSPILAGRYHISYVSASYHATEPSIAICVYTADTAYVTVSVRSDPDAHLEVYDSTDSQWRPSESWWECRPRFDRSCPLIIRPGKQMA